jgi:hypothetical protein
MNLHQTELPAAEEEIERPGRFVSEGSASAVWNLPQPPVIVSTFGRSMLEMVRYGIELSRLHVFGVRITYLCRIRAKAAFPV